MWLMCIHTNCHFKIRVISLFAYDMLFLNIKTYQAFKARIYIHINISYQYHINIMLIFLVYVYTLMVYDHHSAISTWVCMQVVLQVIFFYIIRTNQDKCVLLVNVTRQPKKIGHRQKLKLCINTSRKKRNLKDGKPQQSRTNQQNGNKWYHT